MLLTIDRNCQKFMTKFMFSWNCGNVFMIIVSSDSLSSSWNLEINSNGSVSRHKWTRVAKPVSHNYKPGICDLIHTSVACAFGPSVTASSTYFSFQNLVFLGIYLNFQRQKSLKNQYLPHSESKSYQINSIKSCSPRSFHKHQRHIPIPLKFSATI